MQLRSIDVLPINAGKGNAAEYLRTKLGVSPEQTIVAGDSGNDADMLFKPGASWNVSDVCVCAVHLPIVPFPSSTLYPIVTFSGLCRKSA